MKSSTNNPAAEIAAATPKPAPKPNPKPQSRRPNTKRTGELSEAAFLLKAESLGFKVAKPWGDSERYDFVLDNGSRLWRVQVKCTAYLRAGGYDVQPVHTDQTHKAHYTPGDIDFLAAHIIPLDVWYVVPVSVIAPGMSLRFYPDGNCKRARFEKFREAWHLLGPVKNDSRNDAVNNGTNLAVGEQSIHEEEAEAGQEASPPQPQLKWTPIWRPIWNPKIFGR